MAELRARHYLEQQGLRCIRQNFNAGVGEIDLIMHHRSDIQPHILVAVEVRYRRGRKYGGAAASVSPAKRRRIRLAVSYFVRVERRYARWPIRFDVVALEGSPDNLQIFWLPNAFE